MATTRKRTAAPTDDSTPETPAAETSTEAAAPRRSPRRRATKSDADGEAPAAAAEPAAPAAPAEQVEAAPIAPRRRAISRRRESAAPAEGAGEEAAPPAQESPAPQEMRSEGASGALSNYERLEREWAERNERERAERLERDRLAERTRFGRRDAAAAAAALVPEEVPPFVRGAAREGREGFGGREALPVSGGDRDRGRDFDRGRERPADDRPRDDRPRDDRPRDDRPRDDRRGDEPRPGGGDEPRPGGGGGDQRPAYEMGDKRRRWEERRMRRMERRRERDVVRQQGGYGGGPQQQQQQQGGYAQGGPGANGGADYGENFYDDPSRVKLNMNELSQRSIAELMEIANDLGIEAPGSFERKELIIRILQVRAERSGNAYAVGVVDAASENGGFLRFADNDYLPSPNDVQINGGQMRKFSLRKGDVVAGIIRRPGKKERWWTLLKVDTVNDEPLEVHRQRTLFENLTPLYPNKRFQLEHSSKEMTTRVLDLMTPIGKGQRSLIVAPPRTGKTMIMQAIAKSLEVNHPDAVLMVLLIDERPEEVTDMERTVKGEVISSTFDEPAERHVAIAEMTIERAKRLVEKGKDVVILLDSITRLARAYNLTVRQSGKLMTGGLDANALQRPKRFFGAARNIEEGGSLTIIGTALVDTGSAMDQVIFEEFKGTGNNEINLYRPLAERRIFPAIDVHKSGTRKEELLLPELTLQRVWLLRKALNELGVIETMEFLIERLKKTETNEQFLNSMNA